MNHPRTSTTIQINSLEALERLLGGDTAFEMRVRQAVAVAFAQKHLKPILESKHFKDTLASAEKVICLSAEETIKEEIGQIVQKGKGFDRKYVAEVAPKLQEQLKKQIDTFVAAEIERLVSERISAIDFKSIEGYIDRLVKGKVGDEVNRRVKERFEKALKDN